MVNQKKRRLYIVSFVLMLALIYLWYSLNGIASELSNENIGLRYQGENGINVTALETLSTEDDTLPQMMLWNEKLEQPVKTDYDSHAYSAIMQIYGTNLLDMKMASGAPLSQNDMSGCNIDKNAAYNLFGTTDVIGRSIILGDEATNENTYVIRGVFEFKQPLIIVNTDGMEAPQASGNSDEIGVGNGIDAQNGSQTEKKQITFSNAELSFNDTQNGRSDANSFLMKYSLPMPENIIDGSFITIFMNLIIAFPAIVLAAVLVLRMLCRAFRLRNRLPLLIIALAAMVLCAVAIVCLLDLPIAIPNRLIPSRWSDFSFWEKQIQMAASNIKGLLNSSKTLLDNQLIEQATVLICTLTGAAFILILYLERVKIQSLKQLAFWTFTAELSVFLIFLMRNTEGNYIALSARMFLALPLYFAVDLLINKCDAALAPKKQEGAINETSKAVSYSERFLANEEADLKNKELA